MLEKIISYLIVFLILSLYINLTIKNKNIKHIIASIITITILVIINFINYDTAILFIICTIFNIKLDTNKTTQPHAD